MILVLLRAEIGAAIEAGLSGGTRVDVRASVSVGIDAAPE